MSVFVDLSVMADDQKTVIYQFRGEFPSLTALSKVLASVASSMDGKSTDAQKFVASVQQTRSLSERPMNFL